MASITNESNGRKCIQFVGTDGKRRSIRLGKATAKQADAFRVKIEALVSDRITGAAHTADVSHWIRDLDPKMRGRLDRVGLSSVAGRLNATLAKLLDEFFASLDVKASTATSYQMTRRCLSAFFGDVRPVHQITSLDAEKFRQFLKNDEKLADATVSKRVKVSRQIFRQAVRWKMCPENPFEGVRAGSQNNKSRMYFVPAADARKVLDSCPDAQWRLLFALSRWGGLRCPSEHLAITWEDVDWVRSRLRIPSSKTARHVGADSRTIPLFDEIREPLEEVRELATPGEQYVITRYRDTNHNLRTQLHRIIRRAGLAPWPKTFHNLRSTRQTELAKSHPIHVVCAWLGNSQAVAQDHYLQVTDADYENAVQNPVQKPAEGERSKAESGGSDSPAAAENGRICPRFSADRLAFLEETMSPLGLERRYDSSEKLNDSDNGGAVSGALAEVVNAWPALDAAARRRVLAIVRVATAGQLTGRVLI